MINAVSRLHYNDTQTLKQGEIARKRLQHGKRIVRS